jgi:uncharacterized cupredoxin-like copper-binding protein
LVAASVAQIVLNVVVLVVNGEIIPPLVGIAVLLGIGLVLIGSRSRAGAAMLGIVSAVHLLTSAPFILDALVHPESFWDFWLGWATIIVAVVALVAAIPVWRESDHGSAQARLVPRVAAGLVVALAVVGAVATISYDSATLASGDVELAAENVEFSPAELSAEAGEVSVFVDNNDGIRHTFSIDDLGVDLEVPAGKAARVEFTAEPGTYEFYCAVPGHEGMTGELTVE